MSSSNPGGTSSGKPTDRLNEAVDAIRGCIASNNCQIEWEKIEYKCISGKIHTRRVEQWKCCPCPTGSAFCCTIEIESDWTETKDDCRKAASCKPGSSPCAPGSCAPGKSC